MHQVQIIFTPQIGDKGGEGGGEDIGPDDLPGEDHGDVSRLRLEGGTVSGTVRGQGRGKGKYFKKLEYIQSDPSPESQGLVTHFVANSAGCWAEKEICILNQEMISNISNFQKRVLQNLADKGMDSTLYSLGHQVMKKAM